MRLGPVPRRVNGGCTTTFDETMNGLADGRGIVSSFPFVTPFIVSLALISRSNLCHNCGVYHKYGFAVDPGWRSAKDEACRAYSFDG